MVSKNQGKFIMKRVVERYSIVEKNPHLIKERLLSEQDVTTKFVLPFLEALNWHIYELAKESLETHEKAYKEKSNVGKELPDIILRSENVTVFVEVKRPSLMCALVVIPLIQQNWRYLQQDHIFHFCHLPSRSIIESGVHRYLDFLFW